jgi:hypothetical protein
MILSSLTFINIFKESFEAELSEEEKNTITNLSIYNTKIDSLKESLPKLNDNYNLIKNNKIKNDKIKTSSSSLTNINSTHLTIKNQLDYIQRILGTGTFLVIQKLGITQNVKDTPDLSTANLLQIRDLKPTTPPTPTIPLAPTTPPTPTIPYQQVPTTPYQQVPTTAYQPAPTTPTTSYQPAPITAYQQEPITPYQQEPITAYQPEPTTAYQPEPTTPYEAENNSSNQSISTFMNVAKKSKESFINLLNSVQVRKPVEHFSEHVNWRNEWNSKLESISRTQSIPLSDTDPKINDNETSFYIVQNPNLEKNLENTSSNIIKMQMENMTEILRDKWIEINRK